MPYEVTNAEETAGLVLERTVGDDRSRPYVDTVDEGEKANRYTFVSKRNAFAALAEWLLRYQPAYQEANPYNLRVFKVSNVPSREEVV